MALELVESPVRQNNLIVGQATIKDVSFEPSLRPQKLDEYIGQAKIVNNLKIFLKAARRKFSAWKSKPPARKNLRGARAELRASPTVFCGASAIMRKF